MAQLEFDNETSRLVELFNGSAGAKNRRRRILSALSTKAGARVLDVGSGPGHQASEISPVVGTTGSVEGVDSAADAIEIARLRCSDLGNVNFQLGEASTLPFPDSTFDAAMSSQVFRVPG